LWLGIGLYLEKQKDGSCIRNMVFAFPVPVSGQKVKELSLENEATVEMVCLLVLRNPTAHVNIDVDADEMVQDKRGSSRNLVGCLQDSAKNQVM
jgi:hypothetical protein